MALRNLGHQLLIDDVTVLHIRDGSAWTTPYARNVHLLPDAAAALGVDFAALPLLAGGRAKAAFRAEDPPESPQRLDRIVVLMPDVDVAEVSISEVRGTQRVLALHQHARRDGIAPLVLGEQRYFEQLTELAKSVPVWVLRRPAAGWSMEQVLAEITGTERRQR